MFFSQMIFAQVPMLGTWKVSCPSEKTSPSSAKFCDLCSIAQTDASSIEIKSLEITVKKSELIIRKDSANVTTGYIWNERANTFEFKYQNKTYKFNLLISEPDNLRILKDKDGLVVLFEKKK